MTAAAGLVATIVVTCAGAAQAQEFEYNTRTTYGEVGILDMPSARMAPDGQLSLTVSAIQGTQHYNAGFQILPWLEGSFRYSHVIKITGGNPFYDRSFGLKIRLFQEDEYFPEVSLGLRDILGTGLYAGEYLVASKRVGDFDLTLGTGWGRFAQEAAFPNPLAQIFPSFKTRDTSFGLGGTVAFGQFFHGPNMGLFGGAVWHSPIENLNLLVEYSSDRYDDEVHAGVLKVRWPVNIGVSYRAYDTVTLTGGWFYGTSYGLTVSFDADPFHYISPQRVGAEIPAPAVRTGDEQINALNVLFDRTRPLTPLSAGGTPFVQVPLTGVDSDAMTLTSTLMSVEGGIRDAEIQGKTLIVDATLTAHAEWQCNRYAELVSPMAPKVQTVALSNLNDLSGRVTTCAVRHSAAQYAAANGPQPEPAPSPELLEAMSNKIRQDIAAQALDAIAVQIEPSAVWVYYTNKRYFSESEAAGRIARVLMADAPPSVEVFHIVVVRDGMPQRDVRIGRSALERVTTNYGTPAEVGDAVALTTPALDSPILDRAFESIYPKFHWSIGPGLREGLFDPSRPLQFQIFGVVTGSVDITHYLTLEARGEFELYDGFSAATASNSQLPHVRSDLARYYKDGGNGIAKLDAVYRTRFAPDLYFEGKAGYLENMFAGAGGQILWRPANERFAIGADVYQVWQRNFDRLLGVQDYHVLTGHVSVYYQSPWYDLNFAVHAGRYLAGDYGATIEMTRRFSTGVEIGAFATFTNVPFAKFGEGSFDKGIIVHIPFEWVLPFHSQSSFDLLLRSLTRDGGQRLEDDDSLYEDTRPASYGEMLNHADEITLP